MSRHFIFADEAGCLTFRRHPNVSRYFILCTVTMTDCSIAPALLELRRHLAWENKVKLGDYFHAATDQQAVRNAVFDLISNHDFDVQATIMEKSKGQPHITGDRAEFYRYGWFYHFRYGICRNLPKDTEALVTAAAIGTNKERVRFRSAVDSALAQNMKHDSWRTDFPPAGSDPCIQVADYCAWAIQRKFERNDSRSYDLISARITYQYDLWARGSTHYY